MPYDLSACGLVTVSDFLVQDSQTTGNGVVLRNGDRPLITRGWDCFTSGNKTGIGRWGLFMEAAETFLAAPGTDYGGGAKVGIGGYLIDGTKQNILTVATCTQRVGIGTTSPTQILDIVKDQAATTTLLIQNTNDQANAATEIRLYGNEGVAPLKNNQQISFVRGSGGTDWALGQPANSSDFVIAGGTNQGDGKPSLGTAERIRITSGGNVGIGNTAPSAPLHVCGTGGDQIPILRLGGSAASAFNWASAAIHPNVTAGQNIIHLVGKAQSQYNSGYFGFKQVANDCSTNMVTLGMYAADNLVNILGTGNVGIGTTTPSAVLDVQGSYPDNAMSVRNNCVTSYAATGYKDSAGSTKAAVGYGNASTGDVFACRAYVYTPANIDFVTYVGGATRMFVCSTNGNLGIGTSAPGTNLEVYGTDAEMMVHNISNSRGGFRAFCNQRLGILTTSSSDDLVFGSSNGHKGVFTERMRICNSSGRVGIGTSTPSYLLHVNGTFYAAGSSIKYKEGICNYDTNSCLFMCLKPVAYQYKDEFKHLGKELKADTQIGLIAEDVAEVMPELAVLVNEEDEKVVRNVDYEKLSIVLLAEVQKLRKEMDELKNK